MRADEGIWGLPCIDPYLHESVRSCPLDKKEALPKGARIARLEVLPALRTDGSVTGFCGIPGGGAAALISPVTDAAGQPIGSGYQFKALIGGEWRDVIMPAAIDSRTNCRLLPASDGLSLLVPDATSASRSTLWKAQFCYLYRLV